MTAFSRFATYTLKEALDAPTPATRSPQIRPLSEPIVTLPVIEAAPAFTSSGNRLTPVMDLSSRFTDRDISCGVSNDVGVGLCTLLTPKKSPAPNALDGFTGWVVAMCDFSSMLRWDSAGG